MSEENSRIFFHGTQPIVDKPVGSGADFFRLQPGESAVVSFLLKDERDIISIYEHFWPGPGGEGGRSYTCIRDNCPLCIAGNNPRYVSFAPIYNHDKKQVEIMRMGIKFWKNQVELFKEYGSFTDRAYKIKRTGSGFDTTYTPMPKDPGSVEVPEIPEDQMPDIMKLIVAKSKEELSGIVGGASSGSMPGEDSESPY